MKAPPRLLPITLAEFAARTAAHSAISGGVSALVSDADDLAALAQDLALEIEFIAERTTVVISASDSIQTVLAALDAVGDAVVVMFGFAALASEDWSRIDELRNLLQPPAGLILLMAPHDLENLQDHAPNLSSWLGGRVWRHSDEIPNLTDAETQRRLSALREHFKRTDEDVLASARDGTLPADPEYAEWLILLGHGNLLA
jgi:hypothetical protein